MSLISRIFFFQYYPIHNKNYFSKGRSKSHNTPSTLEITVLSARPLLIPHATSYGVVLQDSPSTCLPSGSVMTMGSGVFAASFSSCSFFSRSHRANLSLKKSGGGVSSPFTAEDEAVDGAALAFSFLAFCFLI